MVNEETLLETVDALTDSVLLLGRLLGFPDRNFMAEFDRRITRLEKIVASLKEVKQYGGEQRS